MAEPLRPLRHAALILLAPLALGGCYVVQQGLGQMELLRRREPVEAVLARPETSAQTRRALQLVRAAKAFAEDAVGLARTRNYEHLVTLDRDAVSYVVSAAPPDSLAPHQWWFPIVGHVPYKGYFARADALAEQAALEAQGLDTTVRGVAAFSLLGWAPDPIYSPFVAMEPANLVNVVIHETTHATLFLPGQASFNEGFATFVGEEGAQAFFRARGGEGDPDLAVARAVRHDARLFTGFIEVLAQRLEALYASGRVPTEVQQAREQVFEAARAEFEASYRPKLRSHQYRHFGQGRFNNATVAAYRTYHQRLDRFEAAHARLGGQLPATVRFFREQVALAPDPEQWLYRWLTSGAPPRPEGVGPGVEPGSRPRGGASPRPPSARPRPAAGADLRRPVEVNDASVLEPLQVPVGHRPGEAEFGRHGKVGGAGVVEHEAADAVEHGMASGETGA
ncbi:MAG: aminopeptidase [Candidatus Sericytochromatia bacterium]|nr:aminopeptidase [Candidatus Sericytochromatia bacterium]